MNKDLDQDLLGPVVRSFGLVETVADSVCPLSDKEISDLHDLPPSSVHRFLQLLCKIEIVERTEDGLYTPGARLYRIAYSAIRKSDVAQEAYRDVPLRYHLFNLPSQALDPLLRVADGMDVILQDDLLRRVVKMEGRQPTAARQRPTFFACIDATMPQQKALQVLTGLAAHMDGCGARPDQIAHRFMGYIRHPHGRQFASPV